MPSFEASQRRPGAVSKAGHNDYPAVASSNGVTPGLQIGLSQSRQRPAAWRFAGSLLDCAAGSSGQKSSDPSAHSGRLSAMGSRSAPRSACVWMWKWDEIQSSRASFKWQLEGGLEWNSLSMPYRAPASAELLPLRL